MEVMEVMVEEEEVMVEEEEVVVVEEEEIITTPTSQCRRKVDDPMPGDALSPLIALPSLLHRPLQPSSPLQQLPPPPSASPTRLNHPPGTARRKRIVYVRQSHPPP
ncbi:hypothetical protein K0M31_018083 [Melipona bicolor]|uniref:Uncharacterized protein n=1 Tax=Melipona bicolor TaxID=60889 RepID=A0AA40FD43_9HYME|nr:hypothetical protein K0M31_018083 [Melipona bicolor]